MLRRSDHSVQRLRHQGGLRGSGILNTVTRRQATDQESDSLKQFAKAIR
jgi:hypothetical protein